MAGLSKSRLMSFLQCPKRLWLEKHQPELAAFSAATEAAFATGHEIGDIARQLYDPAGTATLISGADGMAAALRDTAAAIAGSAATPLFEATFERDGLLIRADVLDRQAQRLIEVKSSTSCKDEHVTDCAIQAWVLETSAVAPKSVALAYVNNQFVYQGDGDYRGLLDEKDLGAAIGTQRQKVPEWLAAAKRTVQGDCPDAAIGRRCRTPYACPFIAHCWPDTDYPLNTLPGVGRRLDELIAEGYKDVRDLPASKLSGKEAQRVWRAARSGQPEVHDSARKELAALGWPRYYLDFETIGGAIPRWAGTRPYQAVPFQWSLHVESAPGQLGHAEFLDLSGEFPARALATALLAAIGAEGPVLTWTGYEKQCLGALAAFCPELAEGLSAVVGRLVDLHPVVKAAYYHPAMKGSWSIKALLPAIAPDMDYAQLEGVHDGGGAQLAWVEAVAPQTTAARRSELREQLLRYCGHDTLAMVRVLKFFS
ncbi:MAG: DUF2779 domain-containing protein [Gammaproteobacteria bacterium]